MEAEKVVQISPLVRRITAGNGSVFTGPGTNTYLVGNEDVTVIDPGPAMQDHIDAITAASKNIKQILVTHTHPDHSPGVRLLKNELDIPAYGMLTHLTKNQDTTFSPERILEDGELLEENEFSLEVVHTPWSRFQSSLLYFEGREIYFYRRSYYEWLYCCNRTA
jgi:glyoxylase-like metal-dependent hydrolase (beta-lactamase superfamily II)